MMLRIAFHRARRALGSIPVVGSSCEGGNNGYLAPTALVLLHFFLAHMCFVFALLTKKTTGGPPIKAMAVDSFLMFPPL